MKEFLSNLNLQDLWKNIQEQIGPWLDTTSSKLLLFLESLYQNALINPLPTGALLLALIGIPLIFLKTKKSKSETDDRLDQLMEEMQDFEIKTPLIDLQKNFSDSPITNMEPLHEENSYKLDFESDQGTPDSDHVNETLDSSNMIELPSLISNEESRESETSSPSEEQETADIPSSTDSIENQIRWDDDKELELEGLTEQVSDWSQISRPALSGYDDTELTIEGIENLQQEMEESILDLPSEQEKDDDLIRKIKVDSTSPAPEPVKPASQNEQDENAEETASTIEEEIHCQEDDAPLQPTDPVATESEANHELSVAEDDHLIPHEETFEESFDNQIPSTVAVQEKIIKESQYPQSLPLKPTLKSQPLSSHTRIKSPSKDYKELLESFILLKDQKR